jgi:hypothetical protein
VKSEDEMAVLTLFLQIINSPSRNANEALRLS